MKGVVESKHHARLKCPACKATWEQIKENRLIGCPTCWKTFAQEIRAAYLDAEYGTRHMGAMPPTVTGEESRAYLERELKAAVAREDFKKAAALKRKIGSPQFRPNAKLQILVEESARPSDCKIVKLLIPPADGNAQSRVYAFDVVVVGDGAKEKLLKSVYAAGANMGIGHEPNGGVTTLRIPAAELPKGASLTFAVRPITSLGTRGKALTIQKNMDVLF